MHSCFKTMNPKARLYPFTSMYLYFDICFLEKLAQDF